MPKDDFDSLIESELQEARNPKPRIEPPPGSSGSASYRDDKSPQWRPVRFTAPETAATAVFFYWLGITAFILTVLAALFVVVNSDLWDAVAVLFAGSVSGMLWMAISSVIEYLAAAAHWSRQTAEALRIAEENRHRGTASKKD